MFWRRRRRVPVYLKWVLTYCTRATGALFASFSLRRDQRWAGLWVISERDDEASDSGYQLYSYIVENHPEINVRYVLSRKSPDYAGLPHPENIVEPGSWEHYLCDILCVKSISTHLYGASPGRYFSRLMMPFMRKKSVVCLQHGVTKDSVPHVGLFRGNIVISSETEKVFYQASGYKRRDGFLETGLPRFDGLTSRAGEASVHRIMVMPTFRWWLERETMEEFEVSEYFKQWSGFLHSPVIHEALERNNQQAAFVLHWKFKRYSSLFKSDSRRITVLPPTSTSVRELKADCAALITDYSSVFLDFAYLLKPVVFYQFDAQRFFSEHHPGGYHRYGFGDYADSYSQIADQIDIWAQTRFAVDQKTKVGVDEFFYYRDGKNTLRAFDAIRALNP